MRFLKVKIWRVGSVWWWISGWLRRCEELWYMLWLLWWRCLEVADGPASVLIVTVVLLAELLLISFAEPLVGLLLLGMLFPGSWRELRR